MDWIIELYKQISSSIKLALAVLLTSGSIVFLKKIDYFLVQSIPKEWIGAITIIFIFSSIFFFISIVFLVGNFIIKIGKRTKYQISNLTFPVNPKSLNKLERLLMLILAELADKSYNLSEWDTSSHSQNEIPSKLEILAASKSLSKKGLIDINPFEENLISLTEKGRTIALKIMIEWKKKNQK